MYLVHRDIYCNLGEYAKKPPNKKSCHNSNPSNGRQGGVAFQKFLTKTRVISQSIPHRLHQPFASRLQLLADQSLRRRALPLAAPMSQAVQAALGKNMMGVDR